MLAINFWAVIVAAVAAFVIGFLMHGPIAGKLWMKLANIVPTGNEKLSDMYGQMIKNFIANIVTSIALALVILFAQTSGLLSDSALCTGLLVAFIAWIGFIVTSTSIDVIWMGKSAKLWLFEAGSSLITFLAMGAILGAW